MRFLVVATVALVVIAESAPARGKSVDAEVAEAIREYAAGDFRAAIRTLGRAVARGGAPKALAQAHLFLGASHASLKRKDSARLSFRRALELDPTVSLDPDRFVPAVVELFQRVREKLTGKVEVHCDRADAAVEIDGKQTGQCGSAAVVSVGAHAVRAVSSGDYREQTAVVAVGKTTTVRLGFGARVGRIAVTSRPAGATVRVGRTRVGVTPIKDHPLTVGKHEVTIVNSIGFNLWFMYHPLTVGKHEVTIELAEYRTAREEVVVETGQTTALQVALEALPAPATTLPSAPELAPLPAPLTLEKRVVKRRPSWPWIVVGVGAAAVGAGVAYGVLAKKAASEFDQNKGAGTLTAADLSDYEGRVSSRSTAANVLFVVGGVTSVVGAVLLFTTGREEVRLDLAPARDASGRMAPVVRFAGEF